MSSAATETTIDPNEKVSCVCGSSIMQKNMHAHLKTKKHLAAVGDSSSSLCLPAECLADKIKAAVQKMPKKPAGKAAIEESEEDSDDELDDIDIILEALQSVHNRLDELQQGLETLIALSERAGSVGVSSGPSLVERLSALKKGKEVRFEEQKAEKKEDSASGPVEKKDGSA